MKLRIVLAEPDCPPEIKARADQLREAGLEVAIVPSGTSVSSPYPYPSAICLEGSQVLDEGYGPQGVISLFGRIEERHRPK